MESVRDRATAGEGTVRVAPWRLAGTFYAACSCSVGCPCALGEMVTAGSPGCSAALVFAIRDGYVGDTDVGGANVAIAVDWPGAIMGGNGTGRMYFDATLSDGQRTALEPVLQGRCGGVFAQFPALITKTLPPRVAPIRIEAGPDETRLTVGDTGGMVVRPMRSPGGDLIRMLHGATAIRDDVVLAKGIGSHWQDPELQRWESGGYAEQSDFDWQG